MYIYKWIKKKLFISSCNSNWHCNCDLAWKCITKSLIRFHWLCALNSWKANSLATQKFKRIAFFISFARPCVCGFEKPQMNFIPCLIISDLLWSHGYVCRCYRNTAQIFLSWYLYEINLTISFSHFYLFCFRLFYSPPSQI